MREQLLQLYLVVFKFKFFPPYTMAERRNRPQNRAVPYARNNPRAPAQPAVVAVRGRGRGRGLINRSS